MAVAKIQSFVDAGAAKAGVDAEAAEMIWDLAG